MSVPYYGDFTEDATVYIPFNTFTSDDPSASCTITNLLNTDIHIHKDSGLTQRNNAAGITMSVDFDGITGNHLVTIDTSDDTVAGFWVAGHDYFVRMEGVIIDGATVNAWIGSFSIENRFKEVDLTHILGHLLTNTGTQIADAFEKMYDVASPVLVASTVMRGTDSAALASVVGALNDAAAAGQVTTTDTLMQYLKQLINILIGTPGIGTFPAEAAPANAVSLAEVIRAIHADVTGLNGAALAYTADSHTHHVAKTGNDSNGGANFADALLTIGQAVTNASSGDTIILWPGDYDETVDLDTANKSLTLKGTNRHLCRIARTGSGEKGIQVENNTILKNLTISTTNKSVNAIAVEAAFTWNEHEAHASSFIVEDCDLFGAYDALTLGNCNNAVFTRCTLGTNYDVANIGGSNAIFNDCFFYSIGDYSSADARGIFLSTVANRVIMNKCRSVILCASSGKDAVGLYVNDAASNQVLMNNCEFYSSQTGGGGGSAYDIYNEGDGTIVGVGCSYDISKVYGTVTIGDAKEHAVDSSVSVVPAGYLGDYKKEVPVHFLWSTRAATSTDGTVKVYKDNGASEVTVPTGITDTRDFDSKTGVHLCSIDLSATSFYAKDKDYIVVLSGAVINGVTVNTVIASFSIEKRYQGYEFIKDG